MLDEPPGAEPIPIDWNAVEAWLGLRLPTDYKALATAYEPLLNATSTNVTPWRRYELDTLAVLSTESLIVYPRHADQGPPIRGGLVDTLLEWSRGRIESAGFAGLDPRDDPLDFATFEPADAEWPW